MIRQHNQLLRITLLLLLGYILNLPSNAQQQRASLSHFSTDNGLTSNAISNIVQDSYGYIWLSTWNGLSRFDGYNFYNYQTGNGSGLPNMHNRIKGLVADNQQNIWLQMYDGRVFVLKRSTDTFLNPFENINGSEDFRTEYVPTVTSAGDVLVVIQGKGLYKLRVEKHDIKAQLITTGGMDITSMAEGYQNDIWLGTDKGVHRMDISNLTIERKGLFLDEHIRCLYSNGYNIYVGTESGNIYTFAYGQEPQLIRQGNDALNCIFVDSHGLVWFSDSKQGVVKLEPTTGKERRYTQKVIVPDLVGTGSFKEASGVLWIRMNGGGYGYYNRETDEVEYFHNDPANPWNLSNTINANLELNEGVVWQSTSRRGLEKLDIQKNTISRTLMVPDESQMPSNDIRAMYYDKERRLLFIANKNSCLHIISEDSSKVVITTDSEGGSLGRIYGINKDSKGNYWICSKGKGLFCLTLNANKSYTMRRYVHEDGNINSLNNNDLYYTVEDKAGNIWVASYGGGVNVLLGGKNGRGRFLHPENGMKGYPYQEYRKVRTLAVDKFGHVWAGTTDGVLIMSLQGNDFKAEPLLPSKEKPNETLMSNDIVCIARDKHDDMWVGTNGGGLAHTTGRDSKGCWLFETFDSHDGLPSEEIMSITFDNYENVWFATDHVLCSFNTGKRVFTNFSNLDGVDETMCSEGAAITLSNGNVLFGTINGYYTVDRKKLVTIAGSMLKLRITDFWLNGILQSPHLTTDFDYYVPDSRKVKLPSHSDSFAFRFASLNYHLQHRIHYQYMLEGYENVWKNADKTRIASYDKLPTGHYKFIVKCSLLESPEKFDQRAIEIEVPPYFLLSSSAIWLYMLLMGTFAILLMFWRQHKLEQQEKTRRMNDTSSDVTYQNEDEALFMSQLMDWIDKNATNTKLSVNDMITMSGLSEEAYNERLVKYTGMTPKELLFEYRMKNALTLLEETDDNIADVAYKAGFNDPTTFSRQFKTKMGMPPSNYRDELRRKRSEGTNQFETSVTEVEGVTEVEEWKE